MGYPAPRSNLCIDNHQPFPLRINFTDAGTYEAVVIISEDPQSLGDWSRPQRRFVEGVVRPCRLRKRR